MAQEVRGAARSVSADARQARSRHLVAAAPRSGAGRGVKLVGDTGEALTVASSRRSPRSTRSRDRHLFPESRRPASTRSTPPSIEMDQVTQQNAAMVEEATAAAHTLRQETQSLSDLIGEFQFRGELKAP
ncbi:hypothetical protein ACRAWD_22355 [Caulobacter segnis]